MFRGDPPAHAWVGRREVLETLRNRRETLLGGRGGFTLLEGEAGVGKTTLLEMFRDESAAEPISVLTGTGPALDNPPPFHLIRSTLARLDDLPAGAPAPTGENLGTALAFAPMASTSTLWYGLQESEEGGTAAIERSVEDRIVEALEVSTEAYESDRSKLFGRIIEKLQQRAADRPILIVLDSLHTADALSIEFLHALVPQLPGHRIWVLGTTVPIASIPEEKRAGVERLVHELKPDRVTLRPLSTSEVVDYVRLVDAELAIRPEDAMRWHAQSGGNPMLLDQLLRRQRSGDGAEGGELGPFAPEDIDRWARELPEAERRVLTLGSVLGHQFDFGTLHRALGEAEESTAEVTEQLLERGVWRERSGEQLEFVRDDIRLRLYAGLTDTRRRILHKRIGEAIEGKGTPDLAGIYALARHYSLGRVDAKAVQFNRRAAEYAVRAFSPQTAIVHLDQALEAARRLDHREPATELELSLELAVQLDRIGELRRAEEILTGAINNADLMANSSLVQRDLLPLYLARIMTDQGRWPDADRLTNEVLLRLGPATHPSVRISVHRLRGEILFYRGDYEQSLRHHEAALAAARNSGNEREIALEIVRKANVLGMIPGRFPEAIAGYRSACAELMRLGDGGEAAYALMSEGVVLSQHGQVEEGLKVLQEAVRLAEAANDQRRVGWSLFNIADLTRERGNLDEATTSNQKARAVLERIGDRFGLAQTFIIEGKIEISRGQSQPAELALLEAFRITRELRAEADELEATLRLAEVALLRHDLTTGWMRVRELERKRIEQLRPDLADDFRRLREALGEPPTENA